MISNFKKDMPSILWIAGDNNLYYTGVNTYLGYSLLREISKFGVIVNALGYTDAIYTSNRSFYDSKLFRRINSIARLLLYDNRIGDRLRNTFKISFHVLRKKILSINPDIIITTNPYPELQSIVKKYSINLVLWGIDDPLGFNSQWFSFAKECILVFTTDYYSLKTYKENGVKNVVWLPPCYDPLYWKPLHATKKENVVFVGNVYKERAPRLKSILKAIGKITTINLYGNGYKSIIKADKRNTCKIFNPIDWRDVCYIYNKHKIVLNLHRSYNGINFRVIEALGSGSFLLTDYARGLEHIIEPKKDCIVFYDIDEIPEIVSFYLNEEDERDKISEAGYRRVLGEHTVQQRVKQIISYFKKLSLL